MKKAPFVSKISFTRKQLKHLYITAACISVALIVWFSISKAIDFIGSSSKAQYDITGKSYVQSYSVALSYILKQYSENLLQYKNKAVIKNGNLNEIAKFLQSNDMQPHKDFKDIYYVSPEGDFITNKGYKGNVSNKSYFKQILNSNKKDIFISNKLNFNKDDEDFFVICIKIYDNNTNFTGIIGGSVQLETLRAILEKIKIGDSEKNFIIDKNGVFLAHPSDSLFKRIYVPEPNSKNFSSFYIANSNISAFDIINNNGKQARVFVEQILDTDWIMGVEILQSEIDKQYNYLHKFKIILAEAVILIVIFLCAIEITLSLIAKKYNLFEDTHDELTGLWTKKKFDRTTRHLLKKNKSKKYMLVDSDIRGFKFLNRYYGEKSANEILKSYAQIILKRTEAKKGICCRGYADHFYAFFEITHVSRAMAHFRETLKIFEKLIGEAPFAFYPKFGISFYLGEKEEYKISVQELIGRASYAKSTIKRNTVDCYAIFNNRMMKQIQLRYKIEQTMEAALKNKEFFVVYQPKISLSDERVIGAEALVRWKKPNSELIMPSQFIPIFEENGFITKLDFEVYKQVFEFLRKQIDSGNAVVTISVNMSRNHSNPTVFVKQFAALFEQYNIPPQLIEVEIIERSSDNGIMMLLDITKQLHKKGFTVAMDDFGSGQSSLNMLSTIPVDVLKFDQAFLQNNNDIEKNIQFIKTLVSLGKQLNKTTLFEGVETEKQKEFLKSIDCDQVQGFYYSKPLSEEDFIKFINKHI